MRLAVHHDKRTMVSSTALSVLAVTNFFFSCFVFLIVAWAAYADKIGKGLDDIERAWYAAVIAIWMLTDPPRLYLAYRGNSSHSVAHLFGFLVLTFLSHFTCMVVLNMAQPRQTSLDYAVSTMQLCFGACEAVVGIATIHRMVKRNTVDFYVRLAA